MPTSSKGSIRGHVFFKPIDWDKLEQRKIEPPFKPKIVCIVARFLKLLSVFVLHISNYMYVTTR